MSGSWLGNRFRGAESQARRARTDQQTPGGRRRARDHPLLERLEDRIVMSIAVDDFTGYAGSLLGKDAGCRCEVTVVTRVERHHEVVSGCGVVERPGEFKLVEFDLESVLTSFPQDRHFDCTFRTVCPICARRHSRIANVTIAKPNPKSSMGMSQGARMPRNSLEL